MQTDSGEPDDKSIDPVQQAREECAKIRFSDPLPVRVFEREGQVIWSEVDDTGVDLTLENSEGLLYHVRSVFVPHGARNPIVDYNSSIGVDHFGESINRSIPDAN